MQKAADAAALGAAVFMPENFGASRSRRRRTLAAKNGYTDGQNGVDRRA